MSRVFLFGECVIRDAYERTSDRHDLVKYVARQSLISAATPAMTVDPDAIALASKFQRFAVTGDLGSSLYPELAANHENIDIVVIDLVVDRFGVIPQRDEGRYFTHSAEFRASGVKKHLRGLGKPIPFGTPTHLKIWTQSAERLVHHLEELGLKEKTLVLDVLWAHSTRDGVPANEFPDLSSVRANLVYPRYVDVLEKLGLAVAHMPEDVAFTTADHKWGLAPYHYVDEAYDWMNKEIDNHLSRAEPHGQ